MHLDGYALALLDNDNSYKYKYTLSVIINESPSAFGLKDTGPLKAVTM